MATEKRETKQGAFEKGKGLFLGVLGILLFSYLLRETDGA